MFRQILEFYKNNKIYVLNFFIKIFMFTKYKNNNFNLKPEFS